MSSAVSHRSESAAVVGGAMRRLLALVFLLFALLAVNSLYLGAVSLVEYLRQASYQDGFYLSMFLIHLLLGLLLVPPFLVFGALHMRRALRRKNRYAIRAGLGLFVSGLLLLASGLLLTRFGFFEINDPAVRGVAYWLHVITPFLIAWLFVLHRLAGRRIRWALGLRWTAVAVALAAVMLVLQLNDEAPPLAEDRPFYPALSRIAGAEAIPVGHLDQDEVCAECHADIAEQNARSMHRLSSFNNPAYRFSIDDTRQLIGARDGKLDNTRLCAACHDPAPLFSGRFMAADFDPDGVDRAGAHAGITCVACHAITAVGSPRGNGDFVIQDPPRYPFAHSDHPLLRAVNRQLIKAKPAFHRATFLKPMHRSAEFCSVCHKVHIPEVLNHYKWLRGQNHYDSFLLSGVSGHRVDSFYYPPRAVDRCATCHMPVQPSDDPAARDFDGSGRRGVHSHLFAAGNTGVPHMLGMGEGELVARRAVLENSVRVDLFGLKSGGSIDGELQAPLRPTLPRLEPGGTYLLETVVRTLKLGHQLTQGTADSNELWLDLTLRDGDRVIGRSGELGADGEADPWAYFFNAYLLDKHGERIDRRNAQDIVTALYDHQIPPGAASVVHYRFRVPDDATGPIRIEARLRYRKFNTDFLRHVRGDAFTGNDLPIVTLGEDSIELSLQGDAAPSQPTPAVPDWQRWNDYGIGLLREAGSGELRQAEAAFRRVEALGRGDGPLNLARVYLRDGRLDAATDALARAREKYPDHQSWTVDWLAARMERELGRLEPAIERLHGIAETRYAEARERGFDFSRDTRVLNELGLALYERARRERGAARRDTRQAYLQQARTWFDKVLVEDPENVSAHFNLARVYQELGDADVAARHRELHARYKPDDQAVERVVTLHRRRNPAADHAAAAVVIYDLRAPSVRVVASAERP